MCVLLGCLKQRRGSYSVAPVVGTRVRRRYFPGPWTSVSTDRLGHQSLRGLASCLLMARLVVACEIRQTHGD